MKVEINGLEVTVKAVAQVDQGINQPEAAMKEATLFLTGAAKQNAPVDLGALRASITPSVRDGGLVGVVGSNLVYAPAQELGTRPFWPPVAALEGWSRRHGIPAFLVARAIARRGIKGRRYLQRALDDNVNRIVRIFNEYLARIIKDAGK